MAGGEPLISLDGARSEELWRAIGEGSVKAYAEKNAADVLGTAPNRPTPNGSMNGPPVRGRSEQW